MSMYVTLVPKKYLFFYFRINSWHKSLRVFDFISNYQYYFYVSEFKVILQKVSWQFQFLRN